MARIGIQAVVVALVLLVGCDNRKHAANRSPVPVPLSRLSQLENEIYPLANGEAYLVNQIDHQLFLLSEGSAVRVIGVEVRGLDPTIYPLPNGAAYFATTDDRNLRIYYLVGLRATEVKESTHTPSAHNQNAPSYEGFLWAQAQAMHTRYRRQQRIPSEEDSEPSE